jgi:hypothetical protein
MKRIGIILGDGIPFADHGVAGALDSEVATGCAFATESAEDAKNNKYFKKGPDPG